MMKISKTNSTETIKLGSALDSLPVETIQKLDLLCRNIEIKELDNQSISIECKKNLFLLVQGNFLQVAEGDNIIVGKKLRLNPLESWEVLKDNLSSLKNFIFKSFRNFEVKRIDQKTSEENKECHQ